MKVHDLGDLQLSVHGHAPVSLKGRVAMLLGILLNAEGRTVRTGLLGDTLWPGQAEESQTRSLQTLVWRLRQALKALPDDGDQTGIEWGFDGYRVTMPSTNVDSYVFLNLARRAAVAQLTDPTAAVQLVDQAFGLWRGGYLGQMGDLDWALPRHRELAETRDGLLETRWEAMLASGNPQVVAEETAGLLSRETTRERPWELRIRAQLHLGRTAEALQSYQEVRGLLVDGLGIEPGVSLRTLQARALQESAPPAQRPTGPPQPGRTRTHTPNGVDNGLRRAARLIGRTADEQAAAALLRSDADVVTIIGPGGVGKTSLARVLVTSELIAHQFVDGVVWVDLAGLNDPGLLLTTVARSLGLKDSGPETSRQLPDYLGDRHLLLVVDNAEHLLDGMIELVDVVGRTANAKILATSRSALHVSGEASYDLRPLSVANIPASSEGAAVTAPAVQLFIERARSAAPDFAFSADNAPAVTAICARLDGLPLAIELAAARMNIFTPASLLHRLQSGLDILSGGPRDRDERQRTLEATLEWSYRLLTVTEQRLLRRLSVFDGGCTLEAVEAVCLAGFGTDEVPRFDGTQPPVMTRDLVPELLVGLARKSLVSLTDAGGHRRIRLLETVRQYAADQLGEEEQQAIKSRHFDHYHSVALTAEPELPTASRAGWLDLLEVERDNLRQAWSWAQDHADRTELLAFANALGWFWYFRGPISEGRSQLSTALESTAGLAGPTMDRAVGLWHAGRLAHLQGDEQTAETLLGQSSTQWRELAALGITEADRGLAYVLSDLGQVFWFIGQHTRGHKLAEQSVAAFRACGDRWGLGLAMQDLGQAVISQRDFHQAQLLYEEILAIYVELDDPWGRGLPLLGLGRVAMETQDYKYARRLLKESLTIFEELDDRRMVAYVLQRLGENETHDGNAATAGAYYRSALATWQEVGNQFGITLALTGLAAVATLSRRYSEATQLAEGAEHWRRSLGRTLSPLDSTNSQRYVTTLKSELGENYFNGLQLKARRTPRTHLLTLADLSGRFPTSDPPLS